MVKLHTASRIWVESMVLGVFVILVGCDQRGVFDIENAQMLDLRNIVLESEIFLVSKNKYPKDLKELKLFSSEIEMTDRWGTPFIYLSDEIGVTVISIGPDKKKGTIDDCIYSSNDERERNGHQKGKAVD